MPNKRPSLDEFEYYHVYNRGVDKRDIFMDDRDRYRFIHDLYEFNDERPVPNLARLSENDRALLRMPGRVKKPRKMLVNLVAFCMMPNHFHLLVQQRGNAGITEYMRKLGTGYTLYFNERYERSGSLFQGRFKAKQVNEEGYLRHLVSYIHANPFTLKKGLKALKHYRWSSYPDYIAEKKNFPSLIDWQTVEELGLPRGEEQRRHTHEFLQGKYAGQIRHLQFEEE